MKKIAFLIPIVLGLSACSQGVTSMTDRTASPCGDKPNCVSTQDDRKDYTLAPFELNDGVSLEQIEQVALQLPGAKTAQQEGDYIRIECTSKIMRFVDDLELRIVSNTLVVRSESRVGHSDFGVNRKRADQLRLMLKEQGLIK